jgi:hypothetical protein
VQRTQLGARGGKVRCGKCGQIFDGVGSLVEEGAEPLKLEPSPQLGLFEPARRVSTVEDDEPLPAFMVEEAPNRRATLLWALAAVLAAAALAAQLAWRFRADLAAHLPATREPLAAACRLAGCEVRLPRRLGEAGVNLESSDLQADPRQESVIVLNAVLRNRAAVAQEYPSLELTLQDEARRPLLRRVLAPRDYLEAGRAAEQGFPAGAELALRVHLDAGRTRATDYNLYVFYP